MKNKYLSWMMFIALFLGTSSCEIDKLFGPKYDECAGEKQSKVEEWTNPDTHPADGHTVIGHTKPVDAKEIFTLNMYLDDICAGEPLQVLAGVFYLFDLEGTGLNQSDIQTVGKYRVEKNKGEENTVLNEGKLNFNPVPGIDESLCEQSIGLATGAEDEIFVNVNISIEISFPREKVEYSTEFIQYVFLDIIDGIYITTEYYN